MTCSHEDAEWEWTNPDTTLEEIVVPGICKECNSMVRRIYRHETTTTCGNDLHPVIEYGPAIDFGSIIKKEREKLDLTLSDIESECGVSAGQLSRIERGKVDPTSGTIRKIFGVLRHESRSNTESS